MEITACGGTGPYTWSLSGAVEEGVTLTVSGTNNRNAVAVPTNTINNSPGLAAYAKVLSACVTTDDCLLSTTINFKNSRDFDCSGVAINTCINTGFTGCSATEVGVCRAGDCTEGACGGNCSGTLPFDNDPEPCAADPTLPGGAVCDKRTQQMKDDGCIDCTLAMYGLVITVEDALGATVATVITL